MFPNDRERFIPDYIIVEKAQMDEFQGDFDSADNSVITFYEKHGTVIMKDPNQDNTDLDKCLLHLSEITHDVYA